jgi:hypothetical protein
MIGNGLKKAILEDGRKAIIVRTSDRITFKQCRRKWAWSSHLKQNLGSKSLAGPLWFGSGVHYGLEDFHGHNYFGSPADAFRAYCIATSKQYQRDLPNDAQELFHLGTALLDYYVEHWLAHPGRPVDETFYFPDPITGDDRPQVEVNFEIPIPLDLSPRLAALARAQGADCILYRGTIDRVAVDRDGNLWVVEYKTAKRAEHLHFETDPQVTVYQWACQQIYDMPIAGVVYLQFVKNEPKIPAPLSTGKISTASNLVTSVPLYRRGLINMYGSVGNAPQANQDFLSALQTKEDERGDRFVQRDVITRNQCQLEAEAQKILLELEDMLNPELALYPNPTRDCSRMCGFLPACVAMDAGADFEGIIEAKFGLRDQDPDTFWRRRLPEPEKLKAMREAKIAPNLAEFQLKMQTEMTEEEREAIMRGEQEAEYTFHMDF